MIQGSNIVVVVDNQPYTITQTHMAYDKIKEAIKHNDWDKVEKLINPERAVLDYGQGRLSIKGETIYWDNHEMHNALTRRMVQMLRDDFPINALVAFMENLQENPSNRAVNELYGFLENNTLPITPDGHFLAYKRVNDDYLDVYTKTVPNRVASKFTAEELAKMPVTAGNNREVTINVENGVTVVSMVRNMVDDDKDRTCSHGLHFCSQDYLSYFGGSRIMVLKINPRDVVSIPSDYNDSKGRACRYEIIDEINNTKEEVFDAFNAPVQETANTGLHSSYPDNDWIN